VDNFKSNLTFLRIKTGKTQSDIAFHCKKSKQTISGWENGVSEPGIKELVLLSEFLDISLDDLINKELTDVHLNNYKVVSKKQQNVHLNVHPNVHLNPKKQPVTPVTEPANSPVNEGAAPYQTAQMVVAAQAQTINALQSLNAVLAQQVAFLQEQITDLKREIPVIGQAMEGEQSKSA
jgi:transcriptional regulator with XRE-family HTH domain